MPTKANPTSSTILQLLLDLKANGYGEMTISQLTHHLDRDKKALKALDQQWKARSYSDKSITWASITIAEGLMNLTPEALKILILLGTYADQTALIRVTRDVISRVTGIKMTTLKTALRELEGCGAIKIEVASAGHKAPIYRVNGELISVGKRNKTFQFDGINYILNQGLKQLDGLKLAANRHTDKQADGTKVMYHELVLIPKAKEKEPSEGLDSTSDSSKYRRNNHSRKQNKNQDSADPIPGQMTFENDPF